MQLLERDAELAVLADLVAAREGRLALIEGRAGVGKTALLGQTRRLAADTGFTVLTARGSELEREFSFGVVRQFFEPLVAEHGDDVLAGAAAPARRIVGTVEEEGGDTSFAMLHALYWLVANASANSPLLLALDDIHWCDRMSLRFVVYLLRRLEDLPVLIAATHRSTDAGTDAALLAELTADPLTVVVAPRPLTAGAADALVAERLGGSDRAFSAACHHATGGNPLLMRQLLSSLASEGVTPGAGETDRVREVGARAVSQVVLLRLARLPADVVAVARAVAVLGDGAAAGPVALLAGVDEAAVAGAARSLARLDVLSHDALGFVHPLVRDAVYQDLSGVEREALHAAAARLLFDGGAAPQEVAAHLLLTTGVEGVPAVDVLLAAARDAGARGVPEGAVAYLRRALDDVDAADRPGLLLELGMTGALISDPAAAGYLREAYDTLDDPAQRAQAAAVLAQTLIFTAPIEETSAVLERAIADLDPGLEDERMRLEGLQIMAVHFGAAGWRELRAATTVTEIPGPGPGARMLAAMSAWDGVFTGRSADESATLALEALADGQLAEADNGFVMVTTLLALTLADRDEALEWWERITLGAQHAGELWALASAHIWEGFTRRWRGDLREAESLLRAGAAEFALWGHVRTADTFNLAQLAGVRLDVGDIAGARALLHSVPRPAGPNNAHLRWLASECELLLAEGDAAAALAAAQSLSIEFPFAANPAFNPWRLYAADALGRLGRGDEALPLLETELAQARAWGAPTALGRALRYYGVARDDTAAVEEAAAVFAGAPSASQLEAARTLSALGQSLRLARSAVEAREPLREALELAERCGADGLVEHVRAEIHATGARPRRTALSGAGALTTSERRVADLAASGQSNRDIAQTLFVTPKTVEMHLSNAYRKLDINSRAQLPTALAA